MTRLIPTNLLAASRKLRKQPTYWEAELWKHLRKKNFGFRFKRQVRIGQFIADICCNQKKLIIEVDGYYHKTRLGKDYDQNRSAFLKSEGYQILRIWNNEVDKDINKVLDKIINALH